MIKYRTIPTMQRIYECDACSQIITDETEVRLVRAKGALLEDPTFTLHAHCVDHFLEGSDDQWDVYRLSHPVAGWLL